MGDDYSMPRPNSLPWMESADAKMIRAHENIQGVAQEINEWFASIKINMVLKSAPERPSPWLVVWASDAIPPIRLSILIGECVHNMRSAVDNLVCGLAQTVDPACKCGKLAFPLLANQKEWDEKADKSLQGIPSAAKDVIRQLQPWVDPTSPSPLTILNKLSNLDKHRACNFTLSYSRNTAFQIHCRDGSILAVPAKTPLYLGDVHTIELPIDKELIGGRTCVVSSGTFVLTFREESDWDELPVIQVLQDCFDHIERTVISRLQPFFKRTA